MNHDLKRKFNEVPLPDSLKPDTALPEQLARDVPKQSGDHAPGVPAALDNSPAAFYAQGRAMVDERREVLGRVGILPEQARALSPGLDMPRPATLGTPPAPVAAAGRPLPPRTAAPVGDLVALPEPGTPLADVRATPTAAAPVDADGDGAADAPAPKWLGVNLDVDELDVDATAGRPGATGGAARGASDDSSEEQE